MYDASNNDQLWAILAAARRTPLPPNPSRGVRVVTRRFTEAELSKVAPPREMRTIRRVA